MIEYRSVGKTFPDGTQAVASFDLTIPSRTTTVFVGSSGCGKTTLLRMVNRMVDPTAGQVLIDDVDVATQNPVALRRSIGYVMQHAGLLPHRKVVDNVATVLRLNGSDKKSARERSLEVLHTVGLDETQARKYPGQLSGGQQQRVGVARGLAADPNILLMDEPFGAVDPIVRLELQAELRRLQTQLDKTIVFVTHDFDEAVKLGDRIAILDVGSRIVQYDTPEAILTSPANEFVEGFVGHGAALKQLTLTRVRDVELHEAAVAHVGGDAAAAAQDARAKGRDWVIVLDAQERPQRWVSVRELERGGALDRVSRDLELETVSSASTLNDALDEMLTSSHGVVVVTGRRNVYQGVIRVETIMQAMQQLSSSAADVDPVQP